MFLPINHFGFISTLAR